MQVLSADNTACAAGPVAIHLATDHCAELASKKEFRVGGLLGAEVLHATSAVVARRERLVAVVGVVVEIGLGIWDGR